MCPKATGIYGYKLSEGQAVCSYQCVFNHLQCHLHRVFEAEINRVILKSMGGRTEIKG